MKEKILGPCPDVPNQRQFVLDEGVVDHLHLHAVHLLVDFEAPQE